MSASILRTSARSLPRAIRQSPTTRAFSIVERARAVAQAAETQVFESTTVSGAAQGAKADWGKQFRHIGDAGLIFFPAIGLFLGWPFIAQVMVNGNL